MDLYIGQNDFINLGKMKTSYAIVELEDDKIFL